MRLRSIFGIGNGEEPKSESALAVIDAATIYGAGRWYFQVHRDPHWEYSRQYKEFDDRLHFEELIHNLLLYDSIVMDHTSSTVEFYYEVERVMTVVNERAGYSHLYTDSLAPQSYLHNISDIVCSLLAADGADQLSSDILRQVSVPWYYRTELHHDWEAFKEAADRHGLAREWIPLALFIYRGLCYSGFANSTRNRLNRPCAYLASPGRLKALAPILSQEVMRAVHYPKRAYADLVDILDLPPQGYCFDHLGLDVAHLSNLASAMRAKSPPEVLDEIYRLRVTPKAVEIRKRWADRLWSASQSCAVGAASSNVISGSTIYGSVNMVVRAAA